MSKTDMTMFAAEASGLIAEKAIQAICLILALAPVPFIFYYITELRLWDTDLQFILSTIAFTAGICILIYASLRSVIWLLCAIVPVVVWALYMTVHGMAWLLRAIIVPGVLWLLSVALPVAAGLFYAAACGLIQWLRNRNGLLNTPEAGIYGTALSPQILLSIKRDMVSRITRAINRHLWGQHS